MKKNLSIGLNIIKSLVATKKLNYLQLYQLKPYLNCMKLYETGMIRINQPFSQ